MLGKLLGELSERRVDARTFAQEACPVLELENGVELAGVVEGPNLHFARRILGEVRLESVHALVCNPRLGRTVSYSSGVLGS